MTLGVASLLLDDLDWLPDIGGDLRPSWDTFFFKLDQPISSDFPLGSKELLLGLSITPTSSLTIFIN